MGDGTSARLKNSVSLKDAAVNAGDRAGVIWTLEASSDLNANVVHFGTGQGVEEHVNDEVEVIVVGVSGSGIVTVKPSAPLQTPAKVATWHTMIRRSGYVLRSVLVLQSD
jgi:hypothetical protein